MAFRRRGRRRRKLQWFPPIPSIFTIGESVGRTGLTTFQVQVNANGAINNIEIPVTFDFGQEELQDFANENVPAVTLADMQGSGWQARRIVGKIHGAYQPFREIDFVQAGLDDAPPGCAFAAGLMVRKVAGQASNTALNVGLFDQDDYTDPWIWRRTWLLGQGARWTQFGQRNSSAIANNFGDLSVGAKGFSGQRVWALFPSTTSDHGSVMDGPHLDAKCNRVIGPDERLFIHFATKALPIQPQTNYLSNADVFGVFDLRMLGNLRRFSNRGHASR